MLVLKVRNAHGALPTALGALRCDGILRSSRNGDVLYYPTPVSTVYERPEERVVFWPQRDYNIAFVLYEALWMLAGRNDVKPLTRYVKTFWEFSDDGVILHGAYGHRWRHLGGFRNDYDQLTPIINRLIHDPDDRRCVLQIWNAYTDLGLSSKDVPCNLTITFQRGAKGELNMAVFCRSNDILFGAYFANAFHFGFLLEYMASKIGCPMGTYTQVSVNWHGYVKTIKSVEDLHGSMSYNNPYATGEIIPARLSGELDLDIHSLLHEADTGTFGRSYRADWAMAAQAVLWAHQIHRVEQPPEKFDAALGVLDSSGVHPNTDWIVSMRQWIQRRQAKWLTQG